jgi:sporulation protein, YlmC/YmxH family
MRLCDLKQKEVINVRTCCCLGCVVDIDIDDCDGCIIALIVPGPGKFSIFGRDSEYVIPWCKVTQIGVDIILVDIDEEETLIKCS